MKNTLVNLFVAFAILFCESGFAEDHTVGQKDKACTIRKLLVKVGESVSFKNEDPFFHNVFSLSDASTFDLGSYPQGQSKTVKFDKRGIVEVECAIHPEMHMTIEVK